MIWIKVAEGEFHSKSDGTEALYTFDVQDWGLQVGTLVGGLFITGRSGTNAKVKAAIAEGIVADPNGLLPPTDIIVATQVNTTLPKTLKGTLAAFSVPYFRPSIGVSAQTGATEEFVRLQYWVGGKPF